MLHGHYLKSAQGVWDDGAAKNNLLIPTILYKLAAAVLRCDNTASNLHQYLYGPETQATVVLIGQRG